MTHPVEGGDGARIAPSLRSDVPRETLSNTSAKAKRRFTDHKPSGSPLTLADDHPSVIDARTLFKKRAVSSVSMARLLKSGEHSRKIGSHVTKGAWAAMPIYTLTLEERATCPRSCAHWLDCYGNKMNWSKRIAADEDLIDRLEDNLAELAEKHPRFLIRLHVLGDFYSVPYVEFWGQMLDAMPGLHVYGYTARQGCDVAEAIAGLNCSPRFRIRTSDGIDGDYRTVSIDTESEAGDAIVCPVQTGKAQCCGTCALCWSTDRAIAFLRH